VYSLQGFIAKESGRIDQARKFYEKALCIAEASGDSEMKGLLLRDLFDLSLERKLYDQAGKYARQYQALSVEHGEIRMRAMVHVLFSAINSAQGNYRQARDHLREGAAVFADCHDVSKLATLTLGLGELSEVLSDYEDAEVQYSQSASLWQRLGNVDWAVLALGRTALVQERLGETLKAKASYEALLRLYGSMNKSQTPEAQEVRRTIAALAAKET
jgi:tetratricopeptide (TPR) repeat protein